MKKLLILVTLALATGSCKNTKKATAPETAEKSSQASEKKSPPVDPEHNSQNSLDWPGLYKGTLPCADCEAIEVTLAIQEDGAYYRSMHYLGKSPDPVMERGKFQWNTTGNYIRLQLPNSLVQWYQVGENVLYHLDNDGKRIEGDLAEMYVLTKEFADVHLEGQRWLLEEMNGESAEGKAALRSPFLSFDGVRKRLMGNDGCNSYTGSYSIDVDGKISIGEMASTEMYCEGDQLSDEYYQALGKVTHYKIKAGMLFLTDGSEDLLKYRAGLDEE
jgi:copper homeostasis protein (lipoprotein)